MSLLWIRPHVPSKQLRADAVSGHLLLQQLHSTFRTHEGSLSAGGSAMSYQSILYERSDRVLRITLNRPDKLNALTDAMLQELQQAFAAAGTDRGVRSVILTGAGKGFCPG